MDTVWTTIFILFLLGIVTLDVIMIVSLARPGDERKTLIVWKASTYTLLGVVGSLAIDVVRTIVQMQPIAINPFTKLGGTAIVYCVLLLFFKKKYGD